MEVGRALRATTIPETILVPDRRPRRFVERLKEFLGVVPWDVALQEW